jgi:phenylacetate-CoA ligase
MGIIEKKGNKIILKELSGRVNDMIYLPSGKVAAGLTFYYISRSILESLGIIKEFVIRQTTVDTFVFDVVMDRPFSEGETEFLESQMTQYLEPGLNLQINKVEIIMRPKSGKIKHFYSELN